MIVSWTTDYDYASRHEGTSGQASNVCKLGYSIGNVGCIVDCKLDYERLIVALLGKLDLVNLAVYRRCHSMTTRRTGRPRIGSESRFQGITYIRLVN